MFIRHNVLISMPKTHCMSVRRIYKLSLQFVNCWGFEKKSPTTFTFSNPSECAPISWKITRLSGQTQLWPTARGVFYFKLVKQVVTSSMQLHPALRFWAVTVVRYRVWSNTHNHRNANIVQSTVSSRPVGLLLSWPRIDAYSVTFDTKPAASEEVTRC